MKKRLTFETSPSLHRKLKRYCAEKDIAMCNLVNRLLIEFLTKEEEK
jgi:hypothetical protein